MVQPLWKTVWRFLKKLTIELSYDLAILLLGIYPEKAIKRKHLKIYVHLNVHSRTTYNSKNMEVTQVSTNRQIDKEDVAHTHTHTHTHTQWKSIQS